MNRIIERIESCIKDPRREPMVAHSQTEMLRQRIYQIMSGLGDADDCDRLCRDGILKMCADRSVTRSPFACWITSRRCYGESTRGLPR